MAKLKKSTRIRREKKRLKEIYKNLPEDSTDVVEGLIDRAAFLRPTLEDLEEDMIENGTTEEFSQGKEEPYDRERPVVRQYNALLKNYQQIINKLDDIQPTMQAEELIYDDGFDIFRAERDE